MPSPSISKLQPLNRDQLIDIASKQFLLTEGLSKVLDPAQSLAVTNEQRMEAINVLTRVAEIAPSKASASSNQAMQVVVQAAGILGEVSSKYWDNVSFVDKLSIHSKITDSFLATAAENDGTLSSRDISEMASQIKKHLSVKSKSGTMPL